jgi:hypothetical protein
MQEPLHAKIDWSGLVSGIQPRIDLGRSFDERWHSYLGYLLIVEGEVAGAVRSFTVRVGPGAQAKHQFRAGDRVAGSAHRAADPAAEVADFLRASALRLTERASAPPPPPPPWLDVPPPLEVYRARGHRRLHASTYETACRACQWGCRMPVTMVIDPWKPDIVKRRFETFCYGPKSCPRYRPGPTRKVPGRNGMVWEEEDWVDEEHTSARAVDE